MTRLLNTALVLLLALAFLPVSVKAETLPTYTLQAEIDVAQGWLSAREHLTFANRTGQPISSVVLHVPAALVGTFALGLVAQGTQPLSAWLNGSVLEVPLARPVEPAGTADLSVEFTLQVPRAAGRLGRTSQAMALGNWFPTLATHRGDWDRRQYVDVGDAFVTEVANFDVEIRTLQPVEVAHTGQLVSRDGTRWRMSASGVRDFALALSGSFSVATSAANDTSVIAYSLSSQAERLASAAAEMLNWYGGTLGPYPYAQLKVVELELPASYGGMEYPGLVMISSRVGELSRGSALEQLLAHEIAHQWFYSLVGNDQIDDPWLDEAFATYAPIWFYLETSEAVGRRLAREQLQGPPGRPVNRSIYEFADDGPYFTAVYQPGARFLHEARSVMGDDSFIAALRAYVQLFAHRMATPRAFLDLLQQHTSANLNPVINRYFTYGAFDYPVPQGWEIQMPSVWRDRVAVRIEATFPLTGAEVWLDQRLLGRDENPDGTAARLELETGAIEPGEYVALTRVWNREGALFERAMRIQVTSAPRG